MSHFKSFEHDVPYQLTEGVEDLIFKLRSKGVNVFLVSGGMRIMIDPIARHLQIPVPDNVRAQTLFFDNDGNYAGFDENEPTCRSGGKLTALAEIRAKNGYQTIAMVGDGATDMEAKSPGEGADIAIGFGGIIERDITKEKADWFVKTFDDLITEL